jgi:hypothetical protein
MLVGSTLIEETRAAFGLSEEAIVNPLLANTEDLVITVSLLRSPVEIVMYLLGALISYSFTTEDRTYKEDIPLFILSPFPIDDTSVST